MNLQEFISYRHDCLVCGEPLTTSFNSLSKRKQIVRQEGDRMTFVSNLASFNYRGGGFEANSVGYSVGLEDLSLCIEFYQNSGENAMRYEEVPLSLLKRFEELHANLQSFSMFRGCRKCSSYRYVSQILHVSLKYGMLPDLMIWREDIDLVFRTAAHRRRYRLFNNYYDQSSLLCLWKNDISDISDTSLYQDLPTNATKLELPLFTFSSATEMVERLNGLVIFS